MCVCVCVFSLSLSLSECVSLEMARLIGGSCVSCGVGANRSQASPELISKLVGDVVGIVTRAMTYIGNPKIRDAVAQRSQAFMTAGFDWSDGYRGRVYVLHR
jgi:hypothetical protein